MSAGGAAQVPEGPLQRRLDRSRLTAHLGRGTRRLGRRLIGPDGVQHLCAFGMERLLLGFELDGRRLERVEFGDDVDEFGPEPGRIGLEVCDHAGVDQLTLVSFERTTSLDEHRRQAPRPLAEVLDADELIAHVARPAGAQLRLDRHDRRVEPGERRLELLLGGRTVELDARERLELGAQSGDLATGDEGLEFGEFDDERAMAFGGFRLPFERTQLSTDLTEQVLDPQQVGFGRVETAFGLLLALAELEDAGRLLDDRPPLLGPSVQHCVDLALADDHVLLTADAGVGEQFLHVEQPAGDPVHQVLGFARSEQHAGDRHLAELDAEGAVGVVDRDADLGPTERGPSRGAGKDHVVHLLATDRLGRLRTEHPRHRIDDVRLARTVGTDDDGDARLEDHVRRIGERLEALQGKTLQEHSDQEATCSLPQPRVTPGAWHQV